MNLTTETLSELRRCIRRLEEYEHSYRALKGGQYMGSNPAHSAAKRATLDVTRALARWRLALTRWDGPK